MRDMWHDKVIGQALAGDECILRIKRTELVRADRKRRGVKGALGAVLHPVNRIKVRIAIPEIRLHIDEYVFPRLLGIISLRQQLQRKTAMPEMRLIR